MTPKHKKFIEEYMDDLDGPAAAIRAGYAKKTASTISRKLLENSEITKFIEKAIADQLANFEVSESTVLREYSRIAFSDITNIIKFSNSDGIKLKCHSSSLSEDITRSISEVQETSTGLKVRMHPKMTALDILAKHLGLVVDRKEFGMPGDFDNFTDEELDEEITSIAGRIGETGIIQETTSGPSGKGTA